MKCKICGADSKLFFTALLLNKYDAQFQRCANCGFLFAADPHWLSEVYKNAINLNDTGLVQRNIYFSKILSVLIYFWFDKSARFLDFAGGYGLFTRLMRDSGFNFLWNDPYCANLLARGFEYDVRTPSNFELLTAFEVFEHLVDPVTEFKKLLEYSNNIVLSTQILPEPVPGPYDWWYYGTEHGQHISFYTEKSFRIMAGQFNLYAYFTRGLVLMTKRQINIGLMNFLTGPARLFLVPYINKNMKSLTVPDSDILRKKI